MPDSPNDFSSDSFDGIARLFPLPGLVVFPQVVQALHIFEMRYREMLKSALETDGLIAMGVLAPGYEADYEGNPAVHPVVCLGKIISHNPLGDGCSNILLLGMRRGRIVEELETPDSFRSVRMEILQDQYCPSKEHDREDLQDRLLTAYRKQMPKSAMITDHIMQSLNDRLSLAILTDLVAYSLDLTLQRKLELLGEVSVERRAECLLHCLEPKGSKSPDSPFPPNFSAN